jgi:hypothetical protein
MNHYDVTASKWRQAVKLGAYVIEIKDWMRNRKDRLDIQYLPVEEKVQTDFQYIGE